MNNSPKSFDKIFNKKTNGKMVRYGVIYGNNQIVFIKSGAFGTLEGKNNKRFKMATLIHNKMGATVICSTNPDAVQTNLDKLVITKTANELNLNEFNLYLIGTSDSGYTNLDLAKEIPQTVKILGINPSFNTIENLEEKIKALPQIKKIFVYGTNDTEYKHLKTFKKWQNHNLDVFTVPNANHNFEGMDNTYISLFNLL